MSHTVKIIGLGFGLLAVCLVAARLIGGTDPSLFVGRAGLIFVVLWLVGAGINMWVGVTKAGYSVAEEAPIFLVVFAIPASVGLLIWWRCAHR